MGRVVKTKVDSMIAPRLTPNNVLITDTWRVTKPMQKKKRLSITESNQTMESR